MSDTLDNNNVVDENTEAQNSGVNMTQEQLNELINKKYAKGAEKAKSELLDSLGVDSLDTLKSVLAEKQQRDEANKSELEKMQEQLANLQAEKETFAKQAEEAKKKAEVNALSAKHGITDVEVFEMMFDKASKGEDFNSESFINSLQESKPYLFGQNAPKPKVDSSKNNTQDPQSFAERVKSAKTQKELDALYAELNK